jgi:hypothetical protein
MDKFIKKLLQRKTRPQDRLSIDEFITEFCTEFDINIDLTKEQKELLSGAGKWININKLEVFGLSNYAELISEVDKNTGIRYIDNDIYISYDTMKYIISRHNSYAIRYMILLLKVSNYYSRYRYECDLIHNEICAKSFIWEMRKLHLDQMHKLLKDHKELLDEKNKIISDMKIKLKET